jgi:beta-lactamase class A
MKLLSLLLAASMALVVLPTPLPARAQSIPPLALVPMQEPALQQELNRVVEANGWEPMVAAGNFAIALVVLEDWGGYRLAMLNGRQMLYAASLPKIAILFAAMVASQDGDLVIDKALEEDLHNMIRVSCNACATRAMARVGRDRLLATLQRPEYGFYDDEGYGGLWVGKDYGKKPAHKRDPVKGLSHGATAFQVARMYYRLEMGLLLDPRHTRMMRDMLSRPGISHKFVKALEGQHVSMLRKSGSWKNYHSDSVLVDSPLGRYILVGLVDDPDGEQKLQDLARAVHKLVAGL